MGGSGSYYDRDVTDKLYRSSSGVSSVAERELRQSSMDPGLSPRNRRLVCTAKNPLIYDFDVTGSMGNLPKIIWDKWPGIVGQIVARKYLPDPEMSITATGDIRSDRSPLQMCDFSPLRNLDRDLKRVHLEGGGGGQGSESYAMNAYYYAYCCDLPNAQIPIYLITGDEACEERLYTKDLREHFGGEHTDISTAEVFSDLIKKYRGNVFRLHRKYDGQGNEGWTNKSIVEQWEKLLGQDRVIHLPSDLAIGDITLGVYAIVSGARTLGQYLNDMGTRPLDLAQDVKYQPQSSERIREVEKALQPLKDFRPLKPKQIADDNKVVGKRAAKKTRVPRGGQVSDKKSKDWKV